MVYGGKGIMNTILEKSISDKDLAMGKSLKKRAIAIQQSPLLNTPTN